MRIKQSVKINKITRNPTAMETEGVRDVRQNVDIGDASDLVVERTKNGTLSLPLSLKMYFGRNKAGAVKQRN